MDGERRKEDSKGKHLLRGKSVLQPAIWASCRYHVLAHKSFQLAPKPFLIGRIDNNPSVIWISPKNSTCPSGKLRTKNTSPMAKSTSPGLLDTTFFARWFPFPPFSHSSKFFVVDEFPSLFQQNCQLCGLYTGKTPCMATPCKWPAAISSHLCKTVFEFPLSLISSKRPPHAMSDLWVWCI